MASFNQLDKSMSYLGSDNSGLSSQDGDQVDSMPSFPPCLPQMKFFTVPLFFSLFNSIDFRLIV